MNEKKVLGALCIILTVSLIETTIIYTLIINSKDSQIHTLTSQKNQLQIWLDENTTLLNLTQIWLNGNVTKLTNLLNKINNTANFKEVGAYENQNITIPPSSDWGFCLFTDFVSDEHLDNILIKVVVETSSLIYVCIGSRVYRQYTIVEFHVNGTKTIIIPIFPQEIEIKITNPDSLNSAFVKLAIVRVEL